MVGVVPIRMETMLPGLRLNRLAGRSLALACAFAALLPATAAAVALGPKGGGPLSPPLSVLAKPSVAAKSPAAQADLLGIAAQGPASLVREGDRIVVTARFAAGAIARLPELRAAGARIVSSSREQQTVTLSLAPEDLPAIATVAGLRSVWEQREPIVHAVSCEGGSAISEGVAQLRVDEAREAFELRGKGITVGVLSDSFDTATKPATEAQDDVLTGDLPGPAGGCSDQQMPVNVLQEGPVSGDEGRAMLQIVHDVAPKAALAFATAFLSEESFAQNIERLARPVSEGGAGAEVIVDDVAWFIEPFFQDGPVAVAIDNVTAEGASYFSAAGNDNLFDGLGNEISSWEAPSFRDSGGCPEAIANLNSVEFNGSHCMDFDPGGGTDRTFGITVDPGRTLTIDLQWAEPWNGIFTDLDAFLLTGLKSIPASFYRNAGPAGTQRPFEIVQWKNTFGTEKTVQLVINRFAGLSPRLKFIFLQNGGGVSATEYSKSSGGDVVGPTIFGHAGAASAIAVAAVPFNDSTEPEPYSSRGPVTHYFGPVAGVTPALPLGSPEVVAKPDLAATDCGATTFFASLSAGVWRFCGTSAAAPHAAAVAALVRQAKPSLSEQAVREALTDTAVPVGAFGPEAVGAGLIDAFEAIGSLPPPIEGEDGPSEPVEPVQPSPGAATVVVNLPPGEVPTPPAPNTLIVRRPAKLVRTPLARARVVFRFGSDQAGVTFLCKIDRAPFGRCNAWIVRRLAPGRHVLKVKARNAGGLVDATPAVFRFRIEAT